MIEVMEALGLAELGRPSTGSRSSVLSPSSPRRAIRAAFRRHGPR